MKTPIRELYLKRNKECTLEDVLNSETGRTNVRICINNDSVSVKDCVNYLKNKVEIIEYEDDDGCDDEGRSIIRTEWIVNIIV